MGKRGKNEGSIRYIETKKLWQGRYSLGFADDGRPLRKSVYGKRRADVAQKIAEALAAIGRKQYVDPSGKTLLFWMREWYDLYRKPSHKANTRLKYETTMTRIGKAPIAHAQLKDLTAEMLQRYYSGMLLDGVSRETVKITHVAICGALAQAVKNRMVSSNVGKDVELPKPPEGEDEGDNARTMEVPEFEAFMAQLHARSRYYPLAAFMANTGLRPGEAIALGRADIDLKTGKVKVGKTALPDKTVQESTKTRSSRRTVPVPPETVQMMRQYMLLSRKKEDKAPLFQTRNGTRITARNALRAFKNVGDTCGCGWVHLHTMRHTYASRLFRAGVDIKTISELLGHKKVSTTYDLYIHLIEPNVKTDSVKVLDGDVSLRMDVHVPARKSREKGRTVTMK